MSEVESADREKGELSPNERESDVDSAGCSSGDRVGLVDECTCQRTGSKSATDCGRAARSALGYGAHAAGEGCHRLDTFLEPRRPRSSHGVGQTASSCPRPRVHVLSYPGWSTL